ncbi:MAG TPA: hypothetical protein VFC67_09250 [Prolixibacteraceae bacterium]|nr:hypothetical protein [Prolixibacteraceae bacterium]
MIFENLTWPAGKVNPSGIKTKVYFIDKSFIKTWPKIVAAPLTAIDNVTLAGDFELVATKVWNELYTTQGKGKVDFEPIGEKDCKMFNNKGTFKFPDISNEAKSLAKSAINSNVVFLVPLPHETEKRYILLGDESYDLEVTIKGDSGDAPGSAKGITIEVIAPATTPLPNYTGALVTAAGSLDCDTGVFTPTV